MLIKQLLQETEAAAPLYRGVRTGTVKKGAIFTAAVRQDRKPADTDCFDSALFNYGIELSLGIKEIRKRSIFASSSIDTARHYADMAAQRHEDKTQTNGVVQLILDPATVVVFNPNIRDSLDVFELQMDDLTYPLTVVLEALQEHMSVNEGSFWKISRDSITSGNYLGVPAQQYFQNVFDGLGIQNSSLPSEYIPEVKTRYMAAIREYAQAMVSGYEKMPVGNLQPIHDVEYIVTGLTSYSGKVLEIF